VFQFEFDMKNCRVKTFHRQNANRGHLLRATREVCSIQPQNLSLFPRAFSSVPAWKIHIKVQLATKPPLHKLRLWWRLVWREDGVRSRRAHGRRLVPWLSFATKYQLFTRAGELRTFKYMRFQSQWAIRGREQETLRRTGEPFQNTEPVKRSQAKRAHFCQTEHSHGSRMRTLTGVPRADASQGNPKLFCVCTKAAAPTAAHGAYPQAFDLSVALGTLLGRSGLYPMQRLVWSR